MSKEFQDRQIGEIGVASGRHVLSLKTMNNWSAKYRYSQDFNIRVS
jgi:hypothetical protein